MYADPGLDAGVSQIPPPHHSLLGEAQRPYLRPGFACAPDPRTIWLSRGGICALAVPPGSVSFFCWISCLFWRVAVIPSQCLHCLGLTALSAAGRMVPFFLRRCQTLSAWGETRIRYSQLWVPCGQGETLCERLGVLPFARTVGQGQPARKAQKLTLLYGSRILHTERDIFCGMRHGRDLLCCTLRLFCWLFWSQSRW